MYLARHTHLIFRNSVIVLVTPHLESCNCTHLYGKGICMLSGAAVIDRIYHGFLTDEKGTVELSHSKDSTGNRLLLLSVPRGNQIALGSCPGVFTQHSKLIKELWLELIWCSHRSGLLWTGLCLWNSCKYQHVCMGQSHLAISHQKKPSSWSTSLKLQVWPVPLWMTLHGPVVDCAVNHTRQWFGYSISLS